MVRAAVVNVLLSQHSWQNTPEPMEVGEIVGKRPHKGKAKAKGNRNTSHSRNSKTKTTAITSATIAVRWVTFRHSVGANSVRARAKAKTRQLSAVQVSTSASSASDVGSIGAGSAPGSMIASLVKNPSIHEQLVHDEDAGSRN